MKILRILPSLILLVALWQTLVWLFALPEYILPSPWQVIVVLWQQAPLLCQQAIPTILETLLGFSLGAVFAFSTALAIAFFKTLRKGLLPLIIVSQAIPTFAIAPLLVIWFGYGMSSKVITAIIMIFFPVTSAFLDGLNNTSSNWLELSKVMGATRLRTLVHIQIPAALPSLASGLRVAAVIAPIGAIIGEWVGASQGLGFLMLNANARMQIDLMFAALLLIVVLTLMLYYSVDFILNKFIDW